MTAEPTDVFGQLVSPKTLVPAALLTAFALRRREGAWQVALGTSAAVLAANVLKALIDRRRPRSVVREPWSSFPSGHSAASTAYAFGVAMIASPEHRPIALVGAALAAATVGVTRVLARQHWPTDVIAGNALGFAAVAAVRVASRRHAALRTDTAVDR